MKKMLIELLLLFSLCGTASLEGGQSFDEIDMAKFSKYIGTMEELVSITKEDSKIAYQGDLPIFSPVDLRQIKGVSSDFGFRYHPIYKKLLKHHGIDFSAEIGTPIYATANGVVEKVTISKTGYGNQVLIKHPNGYSTRYAHLETVDVKEGQEVSLRTQIGKIGSTGLSTGPHLHYEVHRHGRVIDPMFFTYNDKKERNTLNYYNTLIALEKQEMLGMYHQGA
jgi:murein DD-endopeptidase MepM/ murein hydrolase activator NlpD